MKNSILLIIMTLLLTCKEESKVVTTDNAEITTTDDYELVRSNNSEALLVVFPGGGSTAKETKSDFKITADALKNKVSVLFMNFNRHLWIDDQDSETLEKQIRTVIDKHNLKTNKVYIGGMSIGGTVALSLSNYLVKKNSPINLQGTFVVDSPIDLFAIYESSQKDLLRKDFSEERRAEPQWIVNYFEEEFSKDALLMNIQKVSPITLKTKNLANIKNLENKKLRFYTEPDTTWWKEVRQTDFESTNAFVLQQSTDLLKDKNWKNIELIQTKNQGFRSNGDRHPHSWSIVNTDDLLQWIMK